MRGSLRVPFIILSTIVANNSTAYKFDCNYLVWKPIAPLTVKRDGCGSAFSSGYSFVVGGKSPQEWTNRVEYLNPIANKWTEVSYAL